MSEMCNLNTHISPKIFTHCSVKEKYNIRETEDDGDGKD